MFFILSFIPFVFAFLPAGGAGAVLFFGHGIQTKAWKDPAAWGRIFHPRMGRMSSVLPVWTDDIRPPLRSAAALLSNLRAETRCSHANLSQEKRARLPEHPYLLRVFLV